jgi:hypothetical protein
MARVVTSRYRYKPPPREKKPAAPLEGPRIVTIRDRKRVTAEKAEAEPRAAAKAAPAGSKSAIVSADRKRAGAPAAPAPAANDDHRPSPVPTARPSAIVTARKPGKRYVEIPEVSADEHRRVGDLADAMMQEFKRVISEKNAAKG